MVDKIEEKIPAINGWEYTTRIISIFLKNKFFMRIVY